jgi:Mn2+/Fe2+ NRAMP family transporter
LKKNISAAIGAAFLMATSAIGPGFLTQTTVFTQQLLHSFAFIILLSVVIDIIAQITIWRTLTAENLRAQDLGNKFIPHLGTFLGILIAFGGLVFNIGNLAGAGIGLEALFGIPNAIGAILSVVLVLILLVSKNNLSFLDIFVNILGIIMVLILIYLASRTKLDVLPILKSSVNPKKIDFKAITTLVGGTVGGYITFAGAHRLIDAGLVGEEHLEKVTRSAYLGILVTAVIRFLLFFVTLGIVLTGISLKTDNPTASVFQFALGNIGLKVFGLMIWAASITSVLGATYTSISFLKTIHPKLEKNQKKIAILFSFISITIFLIFGKPVSLLLFAGYLNGFILPIGLVIVLLAPTKRLMTGKSIIPSLLKIAAWVIVFLMAYFAISSFLK